MFTVEEIVKYHGKNGAIYDAVVFGLTEKTVWIRLTTVVEDSLYQIGAIINVMPYRLERVI